jgi:hypothetical protein
MKIRNSAPITGVEKIASLAVSSPVVAKRGYDKTILHKAPSLLSQDHTDYCLKIKNKVNPNSQEFKLVYGASGPDLSVPLLVTNATEILCLDDHKLDVNRLKLLLEKEPRDLYKTSKVAFATSFFTPETSQKFLDAVVKTRAENGYWVACDINTLGFERCVAIELDKLGADLNNLKLIQNNDHSLSLEFLWAFPGEKEKLRKITFQQAKLPTDITKIDFSRHQAYLQKAGMNLQNKKQIRLVMKGILETAQSGLFIITGKPLNRRESAHASNVNQYFGDDISCKMEDLKVDFSKRDLRSYGQQMLLAQVI